MKMAASRSRALRRPGVAIAQRELDDRVVGVQIGGDAELVGCLFDQAKRFQAASRGDPCQGRSGIQLDRQAEWSTGLGRFPRLQVSEAQIQLQVGPIRLVANQCEQGVQVVLGRLLQLTLKGISELAEPPPTQCFQQIRHLLPRLHRRYYPVTSAMLPRYTGNASRASLAAL